jgi:hypothetical protein
MICLCHRNFTSSLEMTVPPARAIVGERHLMIQEWKPKLAETVPKGSGGGLVLQTRTIPNSFAKMCQSAMFFDEFCGADLVRTFLG